MSQSRIGSYFSTLTDDAAYRYSAQVERDRLQHAAAREELLDEEVREEASMQSESEGEDEDEEKADLVVAGAMTACLSN